MSLKGKIVFVTLSLLLMGISFQITACNSGADILEDKIDQVGLSLELVNVQFDHTVEGYLYPNEVFGIRVKPKSIDYLPENTTVVFNVIQTNGGDISYDGKLIYGNSDTKAEDNGLWLAEEGTYTIRCDLYDTEELKLLGNIAPRLGTVEQKITVQTIKFEVASEFLGEGTYRFTPRILNPEIGPAVGFYQFHFGDSDVGEGTKLDARSGDSITHKYQKEGNYTVQATLFPSGDIKNTESFQFPKTQISISMVSGFSIIAPPPPLKVGQEYTFRVISSVPLPEASSYEWDFGDGTGKIIPFNTEVTHVFNKAGPQVIYVEVFESEEEAAPQLGSAFVEVDVESTASHLEQLHHMKKFSLDFTVQHDYAEGMSGVFFWDWDSYGEVVWDGVYFSMEWSQYNHSERMTGRVSNDGTLIEQLKIRHEFIDSQERTEWYELEIQNLPFWEDTMPDRFVVDVDNDDVEKYVTYFNSYRTEGYQWNDAARLYVRFLRE